MTSFFPGARLVSAALLLLTIVTANAQKHTRFHQQAILVDTHNDFPSVAASNGYALEMNLAGKTHTDLRRLRAGGVDVQVWSIFCGGEQPEPFAWANREMDSVYAWAARNPDQMVIVKTPAQLKEAVSQGKIASMMGVEGGHMIENDLGKLQKLYDRGARYMTLTWNNPVSWASPAMEESRNTAGTRKGLDSFGLQVVRKMNELGMLIDLSHVGEQTVRDVLAATTQPVLVSHSCVHALCPVFRNLKDDQIRAIGKNGGVIHLNFYSGFVDSNFQKRTDAFNASVKAQTDAALAASAGLSRDSVSSAIRRSRQAEFDALRPPLSALLDHLDQIVKLAGIDHVGLGSDFDGVSSTPQGLDDVTTYPLITEALLERGYSKKDVKKILGGNFVRLFSEVQQGK